MSRPVGGIRRVTLALAVDIPVPGLIDLPPFDRTLWNDAEPGLRTGVLPPGVDEPDLLGAMVETVREALCAGGGPLVLALHEGLASLVDGQFRGPGLETVRDLGRARFASPCSVVISGRLFEDLRALERPVLPVQRFRPVTVGGVAAMRAHPLDWP
ncbi:hypothetical protein EDD29_8430 [Actinocorallia herbida]|uniref:Uncharacterized protein n=1 Tax=Actinocorallia herbida TaxID=58109 RepID=A0A3N1DAY7_9ACTN|nr:hypothetical protein [Actinocorallia herbida]ROO90693.1 hypothetical protein EDD29_8430 [Actinocorallia herbida]